MKHLKMTGESVWTSAVAYNDINNHGRPATKTHSHLFPEATGAHCAGVCLLYVSGRVLKSDT